jgi:hypothetical protein
MPTKLYVTNKMSEYGDASPRGPWNSFQTSNLNYMIDTHRYGDPITTQVITATTTPQPDHIWKAGMYRGITRRLAPQTIPANLVNFLMFLQNVSGSTYMFSFLYIYVMNTTHGDGTGTVFATLRTFNSSHAWSNVGIYPVQLASNDPLFTLPVTIPDDDQDYRLVVEFGGVTDTPGATLTMQQEIGARNINLVPLDDILTEGGAPFFQFSSDIVFKDFILPYNHEREFAIELPVFRGTIPVNTFGAHPLWWKAQTSTGIDAVVSALTCNTARRSKVSLWMEEDPRIFLGFLIESDWNTAVNHPVIREKYVFAKTWPESPTGPAYDLILDIMDSTAAAEVADFLLPATDDIPNLYDGTIIGRHAAMIILPTPPGTIRTMTGRFPSSKLSVSLFAGRFGMLNEGTGDLFIYGRAPLFRLIKRTNTTLTMGTRAIGTDFISFFLVGGNPQFRSGENSIMFRIDYNGKFYPRPFVLKYADASPLMGVSRDSAILYYGRELADAKIQRHDLTTDSPLVEFFNSPGPNYIPRYVIVMSDNTICCLFSYWPSPSTSNMLYHFAPNGTVLHSYTLSIGAGSVVSWISHSYDDNPDLIWIRYYNVGATPPVTTLVQLKLSDGTYGTAFGLYSFNNGQGPINQPCTQAHWGPQFQGIMIPMMFQPDVSGLYTLNPGNKHDSLYYAIDVKIPDPTVRTALIGE